MENVKAITTVDLLGFQKLLNEQFLEIFESKKNKKIQDISTDVLGLSVNVEGLNFFIQLKDLKSISMQNEYEQLMSVSSWIFGFNQERGEVYTIIDLKKIIQKIFKSKEENERSELNIDSRIIYLKNFNGFNSGVLIDELKLEGTEKFTKIISTEITNDSIIHKESNNFNFDSSLLKEDMSEIEWKFICAIKNILNKENIFIDSFDAQGMELLVLLIKNVYLDNKSKKPILVLNIDNLIKYVLKLNPY
jgi:chemotaxis signal transduction protein